MKNMTALMSAFARAYASKHKINHFEDKCAEKIISDQEYSAMSMNLINGIAFFDPVFTGSKEEILRHIVCKFIGPSVVIRTQIAQKEFEKCNPEQYLVFASGYDTICYNHIIPCYELDKEDIIEDKKERVRKAEIDNEFVEYVPVDFAITGWNKKLLDSSYDCKKKSFSTLLGISYYLTKEGFKKMLISIFQILAKGSVVCFDYPTDYVTKKEKKNQQLAKASNEQMKSFFSLNEMEEMVNNIGFTIRNHILSDKVHDYLLDEWDYSIEIPNGVAYLVIEKE